MGSDWLVGFSFLSSVEKDLGVLVESKRNKSAKHPGVAKAYCFMGCISKNLASRTRDMLVPVYSALFGLEHCTQSGSRISGETLRNWRESRRGPA